MFKLLKQNKGQGSAVQYALTFFVVVGAVSAMSLYARRAIQGRIYEARNFMFLRVNEVFSNEQYCMAGTLRASYEPYYANREFTRSVDMQETERILGDQRGGDIYRKQYDIYEIEATGKSTQAPPKDAD